MFSTIEDITNHAMYNVEYEKIEEFVKEENKKLVQPIPEDLLQKTIEKVLSKIDPTDNPEHYWKRLNKYCPAESMSLTVIKNFIDAELMDAKEDVAIEFLIKTLKDKLQLKREETENLKKRYKDAKKLYNLQQQVNKNNAKKSNNTIDKEFDGMYETIVSLKTGRTTIVPKLDLVAQKVIENLHVIMYAGNYFCYTDGCYKNNLIAVKAEATRILSGICKNTESNGIKRRLDDVLTFIKNTNPMSKYPFNMHTNAIPVKNGIVVLDFVNNQIDLENHDPEIWKFSYVLPVYYDANEKNSVITDELKKYTPDWKMLLQGVAQCLLQAMGYGPYKKAYLLKGKKNCGKTTFLDIMEKVLGEENKSKVSLSELTPQYRFSKAEMEGKLVNTDDDLGYFKMSETGIFKKFTGGFSQKIERKGIDPYDVFITSVHFFTTNTPAGFDHRIFCDDAFWERWCFIEFDHEFVKDDSFKQRVLNEKNVSGLFNEILNMLIEIRALGQLPYVQDWLYVREKWTQESNVLYKFLSENMVYGGSTAIIKEDLHAALKAFCYDQKIDVNKIPESINELGNQVVICGGSRDDKRSFAIDGKSERKHCFIVNYIWKPFSRYECYASKEIVGSKSEREVMEKIKNNESIENIQAAEAKIAAVKACL